MFKIARKDLKLFLTDKRGVLLTFLLPISLITLFAFIFGGAGGEKNDATPISLLISDLDKTELSTTRILPMLVGNPVVVPDAVMEKSVEVTAPVTAS